MGLTQTTRSLDLSGHLKHNVQQVRTSQPVYHFHGFLFVLYHWFPAGFFYLPAKLIVRYCVRISRKFLLEFRLFCVFNPHSQACFMVSYFIYSGFLRSALINDVFHRLTNCGYPVIHFPRHLIHYFEEFCSLIQELGRLKNQTSFSPTKVSSSLRQLV